MFTGLIETMGRVAAVEQGAQSLSLTVEPSQSPFDVAVGASVAVSGVCLTLERSAGRSLVFTAVYETLSRSTLAGAYAGRLVNLERAMKVGDRLDGHFVLGHVDGTGRVVRDRRVGASLIRDIRVPPELVPYMAEKGSVAIDGISLTLASSVQGTISVSFVPHTIAHTTMASLKPGDTVNIECDVLARYIRHMLRHAGPGATSGEGDERGGKDLLSTLMRAGF